MGRLTARDEHGNAYYPKYFDEPCNGGGCTKDMCDFAAEVCNKIAAYEDTGLDPEQLSAIDEEYSKMAKELAELRKYKCLGTLEEVRKAVEKQMAKKPTYEGDGYAPDGTFVWDEWLCPRCGSRFEVDYEEHDYCPYCGQRIDWSEEE